MNIVGKIAGLLADKMMNTLWPLDAHTRAYLATLRVSDKAAEDLAAAEATRDVYEPEEPLADWEKELLAVHLPDDLWAAEERARNVITLPDNTTLDELVTSSTPGPLPGAGPRNSPQPAQGRAGKVHTTTDQVAHVIAVVLRGQGINSAAIYADLAARELGHHFDFTRK
jgi:hypothetical protein